MKTDQHGFTLIEVMVAIMLMAIVSLIAWRGLDSVSRADSHLQSSTEQTQALLRTLNQLERDLALRASIELRTPGLTEDEQPDDLPAVSVRSSDNQDFQLNVIRSAAPPEIGLQRVRWWLDGDTLYRATSAASDRYPLPAPKKQWPRCPASVTCRYASGKPAKAGVSSPATARTTLSAWRSS